MHRTPGDDIHRINKATGVRKQACGFLFITVYYGVGLKLTDQVDVPPGNLVTKNAISQLPRYQIYVRGLHYRPVILLPCTTRAAVRFLSSETGTCAKTPN